jgi:hypothetical protein
MRFLIDFSGNRVYQDLGHREKRRYTPLVLTRLRNYMIDIKLAFEKEAGLDLMDPLGDITISDGSSSIVLNTTYLDSWLAALIAGYKRVRGANHVSVEVAEEPIALHIEVTPNGLLSISYEDQALIPQPPEALEAALKKASKFLLEALGTLPDGPRNSFLDPIREFISTGSNGASAGD